MPRVSGVSGRSLTRPILLRPDQRGALNMVAPLRAADLLDLDDFLCLSHGSIP
jgi:hypothetical protein